MGVNVVKKLLNKGDVVFPANNIYFAQNQHVIGKVTDEFAFCGNLKFKRDYEYDWDISKLPNNKPWMITRNTESSSDAKAFYKLGMKKLKKAKRVK